MSNPTKADLGQQLGLSEAEIKSHKRDELVAMLEAKQAPVGQAAQLAKYKGRYEATTSSSGNSSLHNGDAVATTLAGSDPATVIAAAERLLDLEAGELAARYAKLNPGQQRMNAGNRIRGAVKRGDVTPDEVAAAIAAV